MINIKTRQKLKLLTHKLIDMWYFLMKPLACLCDKLYKYNEHKRKTKHYSDKKITRHLNKQIQKLILYYINNKYSDDDFILIDGEFNDNDNEYSGIYSVKDLFYNCWSILHDKYLRRYETYCGLNESQLIDKWINVILALCIENGFIVREVTKEDIGLHKYDYNYENVNKVYRIEYRED